MLSQYKHQDQDYDAPKNSCHHTGAISLDQLMEEPGQVGKYMNLSSSALIEILQRLDNDQMLKLVNNFGSRYIELDSMDDSNMLNIYYQMIGRETTHVIY